MIAYMRSIMTATFRQSLKWQGLQPDNVRFTSNGEDTRNRGYWRFMRERE